MRARRVGGCVVVLDSYTYPVFSCAISRPLRSDHRDFSGTSRGNLIEGCPGNLVDRHITTAAVVPTAYGIVDVLDACWGQGLSCPRRQSRTQPSCIHDHSPVNCNAILRNLSVIEDFCDSVQTLHVAKHVEPSACLVACIGHTLEQTSCISLSYPPSAHVSRARKD